MITITEKQTITDMLGRYVKKYGSQNKASASIGVSSAIVSQMMNHKWELIADEMWRKVSAKIGYTKKSWTIVKTRDFKMITSTLKDSQENSNVYAITGDAGSGKSKAIAEYAVSHKRVYLLHCNEFWNRKQFLVELLKEMGKDASGFTVAELMSEIVRLLKQQDRPLIIMDEADKIKDQVLYFFITLYNSLEDQCGIIMIATSHLEKRINKGVRMDRRGFREIYSRIGRRFIQLKGVGSTDVQQICIANGIEDHKSIKEIYQDSEGDLRRVKRKIHAFKMIQKQSKMN